MSTIGRAAWPRRLAELLGTATRANRSRRTCPSPQCGVEGAGCPTGGTSLALGGRDPETRETKRHFDKGTTSGPRGPEQSPGAEADDTLETVGPMTRIRTMRVSMAAKATSPRRDASANARPHRAPGDGLLGRVRPNVVGNFLHGAWLASSSPVLREAHASLRPTEPVGLYKLSDALTHVSTATWWGGHSVDGELGSRTRQCAASCFSSRVSTAVIHAIFLGLPGFLQGMRQELHPDTGLAPPRVRADVLSLVFLTSQRQTAVRQRDEIKCSPRPPSRPARPRESRPQASEHRPMDISLRV